MTGFNLPPGCNVSDIPGNRPEDLAAEAAYEALCEELETSKLVDPIQDDEEWADRLVMFILRKMGEAHQAGWNGAVNEQKSHEEQQAIEKATEEWRASEAKK